jgi:hypothetical protein
LKIVSPPTYPYPDSWNSAILNRAPVLKELILNRVDEGDIFLYLESLEADQLERLEICNPGNPGNPILRNTGVPYLPNTTIFPSLRHIRYDGIGRELIPYLLESAPNVFTLHVYLETHHEYEPIFVVEIVQGWLAPRGYGTIPAPYLKILRIKVTGSQPGYDTETRSSVLRSVNVLLSARRKAGAGRSLSITISWEDDPGAQLCWEDGQLVFPSS